jgi:hypothetical protein
MNDFKMAINGCKGVIKARSFYKTAPEKERTVSIGAGPGASPALPGRKVSVKYSDGSTEYINSYDLDYVIKDGKKVFHIDANEEMLPEPVQSEPAKPVQVRRKRPGK